MLSLALLTLVTSPVAQASDPWTYAPVSGGGFGWRHNSVKRESGAVTAEMMTYFGKPREGQDYSWLVQTIRFDCKASKYTTVTGSYLDPAGKAVTPVSAGMIWPVEPGSVENIVFQVLCNSANFTDGKTASSRAAAMKALDTP